MELKPETQSGSLARIVLRGQSDERLVALAREGRPQAFAEIVRRYRAPLLAFASAYVPGKAEDVVQDSFESSWIALQRSRSEIQLKPWLYAIVRNRALNARRDTRHHEQLDERIDGVRRPEQIVLERAELDRVVAAVATLPEAQREALVRSALDGRTHDQIAEELGVTPGSVRGLIHRARASLRAGFAILLPLPLVRLLTDTASASAGTPEAVAGIGAGGAAAVSGASMALKGAAMATLGALTVGSGIAIERSGSWEDLRERLEARADARADSSRTGKDGSSSAGAAADGRTGDSSGPGPGGEGGGEGPGESSGPGPSSGEGPGGEPAEDHSGPSARSGPGHSGDGSDGEDDDSSSGSSGSGTSGSGHDGSDDLDDSGGSDSGSSGSGSSLSASDDSELEDLLDDSSGSGSGGDEPDDDD
jgi:RNA polymerase sigma-70 factor (ECF subfamily)